MDELYGTPDESRPATVKDLAKGAIIAGVAGGIVSAIPVLNWINCCFCIGIVATGAGALGLALRQPGTAHLTLSMNTVLAAGGIAGAVAGVISSIGSFFFNLITALFLADFMSSFYREVLPYDVRHNDAFKAMTGGTVGSAFIGLIVGLPLSVIGYGIFGAIGSFAMAQFKFKDRLK